MDPRPTPPQPPIVFNATPTSLVEDAKALITATKQVWDTIVSIVRPTDATFDNTISHIIQDENTKSTKLRVLQFYSSTNPCK